MAAMEGSGPARAPTSRAVRRRSRPTAHTASRARTTVAFTCSELGGHEGRAEAAVELGFHPVEPGGELVDAVADQQGRLRVAQQRPHAGHPPELAVDRLDLRRHLTDRVGEATVRDTIAGRGEGLVEPAHQRGGVRHRAGGAAADDPDDATHGGRG